MKHQWFNACVAVFVFAVLVECHCFEVREIDATPEMQKLYHTNHDKILEVYESLSSKEDDAFSCIIPSYYRDTPHPGISLIMFNSIGNFFFQLYLRSETVDDDKKDFLNPCTFIFSEGKGVKKPWSVLKGEPGKFEVQAGFVETGSMYNLLPKTQLPEDIITYTSMSPISNAILNAILMDQIAKAKKKPQTTPCPEMNMEIEIPAYVPCKEDSPRIGAFRVQQSRDGNVLWLQNSSFAIVFLRKDGKVFMGAYVLEAGRTPVLRSILDRKQLINETCQFESKKEVSFCRMIHVDEPRSFTIGARSGDATQYDFAYKRVSSKKYTRLPFEIICLPPEPPRTDLHKREEGGK